MVGGEIKGDCGESARRMPGTKGGILYVSGVGAYGLRKGSDVLQKVISL